MGKETAPGPLELRFAAYIEGLAEAAGHADRHTPLKNYCTDLLLPGERKSVEPMAASITLDAKLPQPIAAKPMRAKQSREIFVDGADRLLIRYGRPNQPVHVLHHLDFCLDGTHPTFTIPLAAVSAWPLTLYNTVVLEAC